ncbi:MAG: hypothetical protein ABGY95_02005 [Rubritalea sp.]|uniref:hypothetical protein n=1 Tax=Rubritalea sp. TaxID=2109375 RepID=UPI003242AC62
MKSIYLILSSVSLLTLASCSNSSPTDSDLNPVIADKNYPSAFQYKTSKNQVISPYRPYNVIDVKGMKPGHLSRDPSTAKKDKAGKPIPSTAKIFRIPEFKN